MAKMRATDEAALICDFAQFYHIYDYKSLPVQYAAILACGLPEDSRSIRKLMNLSVSRDTALRAAMLDQLKLLVWFKTKDGAKGKNRPASVLDQLLGRKKVKDVQGFNSAEEFEAARQKIIDEGNKK